MFRWLVDRLSTLALALILALIVWFVAVQETNPIVEELYGEPVPIRLLNQPAGTVHISSSGLVLPDEPKEYLQVTVRGPRQTLAALEPASFKATADLTDIALGGGTVPVTVTIDDPLVEIVGQDVAEISVRLEEYRTITLPVVTEIVGQPALGHVAGTPLVEPSEVSLEGPASRVDPLSQAVVRVSIEGAREIVKETTLAQLRDVNNRLVVGFDSNQLQVSVTVPVTKSDEYAELFVTVNITGSIATGYRLADFSVEPQRVTIKGPPEVVQALPSFISTLPIDVSGADSDLIQRVGLVVPAGLTQVGAQSVLVEIDVEPVLTTLTVPWRPTIVGPDEGMAATISPEIVNISLTGPIGQMDIFDPESDLTLTLNLYGMLPGSYQVELVPLSNVFGVTVESVLPPSVQVEVYALPTPTPTPTITTTIAFTGTVTPGLTLTPIPSPLGTPTVTPTPTGTP